MASVVNTRDVLLLAASPRLLWTGTRGVTITSDYASFMVTDGVSAFPTITFTATKNGVSGTVNWSVSSGTATITPPASGDTATLDFTNMISDIITVKAEVIDGGITYQSTLSITKISNGLAPKYLTITAPSQMFTRADAYTAFTPSGITLTATPFGGVAAGAYTWKYWTGSAWSAPISGATSSTLALTSSSFTQETRTYQASVVIGTTTVTDEYTVVRLTGGTGGFTGYLTNEAVTMATDAAGTTPANIATLTAGNFLVFLGSTNVTGSCTFTKVDSGCTTSITNATGAYSAATMSSTDSASSTFTATHTPTGLTLTKKLNLSKAKTGVTGSTGNSTYTATVYYRGTNPAPTANAATGSYSFSTGVLTPPTGNVTWLATQPATTTDPTWACDYTFTGTSGTIVAGSWSTPRIEAQNGTAGAAGANGEFRDVIQLYGTTTTAPTTAYYNFTNNTISSTTPAVNPVPNWSLVRPAATTSPTYITTCLAKTTTPNTSVTLTAWTTPIVVQQNGTNGVNGTRTAVLDVYQWAVSAPTSFPIGTSTYTWATGQFTAPTTLNGWSLTPPAAVVGQTLWIARTVFADSLTTSTSSITWSATAAISVGGSGVNGQRVGFLEVYRWAASAPTSYPSGTSTYTWATGAFTAPTTPNGWSVTPSAPVAGQTLWGISVSVSDSLTTSTSVANWNSTTVYAVGAAGSNGSNGANAKSLSIIADSQLFQISKSNTVSPSSIIISNSASNLAGSPTYTVISGTATLTGTGATRTLTYSNLTTDTATIQVSQDGLVDTVTIIKVREGVDSIAAYLTNESVTLQADNSGNVSGYTGASGTFKVYYGSADVTASCSFSIQANPNTLTSTISDTAGTKGNYAVTGGFSNAIDTSSITYRATYTNAFGNVFTIDKIFTLAKSKTGNVGATGNTGNTGSRASVVGLYVWGYDTLPILPSGTTTYTWSTGTYTHTSETNGWQTSVPTDNGVGKTLYYVEKPVVDSTGVATSTAITWAGATRVNLSRNGNASYTCYSKFTGNGATPSGTVTTSLGTYPSATAFTGATFLVAFSNTQPSLSSGEALYISDGYSTTSGTVVWGTPYVSSFRVGSLAALSADLGTITAGNITLNSTGFIRGGQTAYNTGTGFWLGYDGTAYKFSIGNATSSLTWSGTALTLSGDVVTSGKIIATGAVGVINVGGTDYTGSVIGASSTGGTHGIIGVGTTGTGVFAFSTGAGGNAIVANRTAAGGMAVQANATTGIALYGNCSSSSGTALDVSVASGGYAIKASGKIRFAASSPLELGTDFGTAGQVMVSGGTSATPSWSKRIDGGSGSADASGNLTVTFTNAFPSTNYGLSANSTSGNIVVITAASTTSATFQVQDRATGSAVSGAAVRWTAVG